MTPNEPPNPYAAPTAALADGTAAEAKEPVLRKPSRLGAIAVSFFASPLMGAGLYNLRRPRRFAFWAVIGMSCWLLALIAAREAYPKLLLFALAAGVITLIWSVVDTGLARAGQARSAAHAWLAGIAFFGAALGLGIAARHWVVESFQTPSASMVPTLLVGDYIFVKKGGSGVARGDVIVFEFPGDRSTDYIKRVVAVGGDVVEVKDGIVSINGVALAQQEIEQPCSYETDRGEGDPCTLARETNAGRSYTVMFSPGAHAGDHQRQVIPEGQVFVLGDNRDNSFDSRKWGTVPVDHVKGTASMIWWSRGRGTGARARWSRIGHGIQ